MFLPVGVIMGQKQKAFNTGYTKGISEQSFNEYAVTALDTTQFEAKISNS